MLVMFDTSSVGVVGQYTTHLSFVTFTRRSNLHSPYLVRNLSNKIRVQKSPTFNSKNALYIVGLDV